jgi:hypothetical protein
MSTRRVEEPVSVSDTARISNRLATQLTNSFPIAEKIVLKQALISENYSYRPTTVKITGRR